MRTLKPLLLFICLLVLTGTVQSHGKKADAHDGQEVASGEVDREQRAWGMAAAEPEAARRIEVFMNDTMRFVPDDLTVRQGETVTFSVVNAGNTLHEFVLGTQESIDEHAAMMKRYPNMEHAEPYMAHVPPGESGEITWTFNRGGKLMFACLVAGHYEAGMVGFIDVQTSAE